MDSKPKSAHGGRRAGAGRKPTEVKVKSPHPLPKSAWTKAAADAGKAMSEDVLEEGKRLSRHELHAQKREMTSKMGELGLAPLDVLQSCMLMLYERALDAKAAGGALVTTVRDKPIVDAAGVQELDESGAPLFSLTTRVDTEVALTLAAADVANKAAQYVHPKLLAVGAKLSDMTYEERLQRLHDSDGNLPGWEAQRPASSPASTRQ